MKTVSYEEFSSKIHSLNPGKRILFDASLELTYRCNNRCVHCFCNLLDSDPKALQEELTTKEVKYILDELASMGCLWLLFTGGEPLLRQDFKEIYLYAKLKGFLITLFTNGTLLDKDTVDLLSQYPPFVVEISLYGATKETYEKVTRVQGSYDRCIEGINRVVDAGIKLKLKTMALTVNQHEIEAMDKMSQDLGCEFRFDPMIQKRIDDNKSCKPEKYRISPEDVVRLDMMFPKRMEAHREFCKKFIGKPQNTESLYQCGAGKGSLNINPYGIVMGCMMMTMEGFSLKEQGLKWIWEQGILSIISQKKDFPLPCDDCSLINLCGQCPAWSILEYGDVRKELTYLCKIAKKRGDEFDFIKLLRKEEDHEKEKMVKT